MTASEMAVSRQELKTSDVTMTYSTFCFKLVLWVDHRLRGCVLGCSCLDRGVEVLMDIVSRGSWRWSRRKVD